MEAARSESPPSAPATNDGVKPEEVSPLKRAWVNMSATLQEHFRYFKASLYGLVIIFSFFFCCVKFFFPVKNKIFMILMQGKKVTARSEKEAAEADLQAAKMQVEAADAAEESKNKISQ